MLLVLKPLTSWVGRWVDAWFRKWHFSGRPLSGVSSLREAARACRPERRRRPLASEVAAKPVNDDEDFLYMFYPETEHARSAGVESQHRIGAVQLDNSPGISPQAIGAQGVALAAWSRGENTWDRLAELQLPVLVASGAHDILMHPFGAYSMSQRLPHAKVVIYSDAGHAFLFQHIEDFSREVDDFLA